MPSTIDEKLAFSSRLKLALTRSRKKIDTAAELALQFNLRHTNDPVTQQAAQKWLSGKAKPTADKIDTLAEWLGVSPHWLRFGSPTDERTQRMPSLRQSKTHKSHSVSESETKLIHRYRLLSPHQQQLITELVDQLALERESWPKSE